jgi:hypothetical protein
MVSSFDAGGITHGFIHGQAKSVDLSIALARSHIAGAQGAGNSGTQNMDKQKARGIGCLVVVALLAAVWIVSLFGPDRPKLITMQTPDHFAMIIPDDADAAMIEAAAREQCADRQWCKVLGWTDEASAARTLPMLERESSSVVFNYFVNRASGAEDVLWDCQRFPAADRARCMAP